MQSFSVLKQMVLTDPLGFRGLKQTLQFEHTIYATEKVAIHKPQINQQVHIRSYMLRFHTLYLLRKAYSTHPPEKFLLHPLETQCSNLQLLKSGLSFGLWDKPREVVFIPRYVLFLISSVGVARILIIQFNILCEEGFKICTTEYILKNRSGT
jgi:hypothetical protein